MLAPTKPIPYYHLFSLFKLFHTHIHEAPGTWPPSCPSHPSSISRSLHSSSFIIFPCTYSKPTTISLSLTTRPTTHSTHSYLHPPNPLFKPSYTFHHHSYLTHNHPFSLTTRGRASHSSHVHGHLFCL